MASKPYPGFLSRRNTATFNISTASVRALLVTSAYTYSDAHEFVDDVSANEVSGGSYARQTLGSVAQSTNTTTDRVIIDAADPTFSAVPDQGGSDIGGVIYYVFGSDDTDSYLISFQDATDVTANGSDISVTIPALGIFYDQY